MRRALLPVALVACATTEPDGSAESGVPQVDFALTSSAFGSGETIPLEHECGPPFNDGPGENRTPPLSWTPGPEGTTSYVVVMRDRDFRPAAFPDGLVHWTIYDIPATVTDLPAGIPDGPTVADPAGAKQGEAQGSDFFGYFGPCSPSSINTYRFTVYAMPEATLGVPDLASEIEVADAAESGALAKASLRGES